jgi:hypothetical protein
MSNFKHEFINQLDVKNLLFLRNQIDIALNAKDANDILERIKVLENQKIHAKTREDHYEICKDCDLLYSIAGLKQT